MKYTEEDFAKANDNFWFTTGADLKVMEYAPEKLSIEYKKLSLYCNYMWAYEAVCGSLHGPQWPSNYPKELQEIIRRTLVLITQFPEYEFNLRSHFSRFVLARANQIACEYVTILEQPEPQVGFARTTYHFALMKLRTSVLFFDFLTSDLPDYAKDPYVAILPWVRKLFDTGTSIFNQQIKIQNNTNVTTAPSDPWEKVLENGYTLAELKTLLKDLLILDNEGKPMKGVSQATWVAVADALVDRQRLKRRNKAAIHRAFVASFGDVVSQSTMQRLYNDEDEKAHKVYTSITARIGRP